MMIAAVNVASTVSQRGATNGPILRRLAVNITSAPAYWIPAFAGMTVGALGLRVRHGL
jgi:hypothetical protein